MTASEDPTKNLRVPAYVFVTAAIVTAEPGVTSSTPWFQRAVESAFMNGYVAGHRAGREDAAEAVWAKSQVLRGEPFRSGQVGIEYVNGMEDATEIARGGQA